MKGTGESTGHVVAGQQGILGRMSAVAWMMQQVLAHDTRLDVA